MIVCVYHNFRLYASRLEGHIETFFAEHSRLLYWTPVALGVGIEVYFSSTYEPGLWNALSVSFILSLLTLFFRHHRLAFFVLYFLSVFSWGISLPTVRAHVLATPLLSHELPPQWIEGQIEKIETFPNAQRLTLYHPLLKKPFSDQPLTRVRVSLKGRLQLSPHVIPGDRVRVRAILTPPAEPAVPGAYHFRRQAYFEGISAQGFALAPVRLLNASQEDISIVRRIRAGLEAFRHTLNQHFERTLKAPGSALAKALVTGDRASVPESVRLDFAASGTAHLLAISGLHLSVVAGFAFLSLRFILSLITPLALRFAIKKWAAFGALAAVSFYWLICGGSIPATRALIMSILILGAVMVDRRAITLRNVALAATLVLICLPEALLSPSFQLSFAAVIALVATYEHLKNSLITRKSQDDSRFRQGFVYFLGVASTTLIATIATTPYLAATFHNITLQAIPANLLAVPWTTFIIMPLLVLSLISMPLAHDLGISYLLEKALNILMYIAHEVGSWPGSMVPIPSPRMGVMSLLTLGSLWVCLIKTPLRFWGGLPIGGALVLWILYSPPPDLFIESNQKVIGIRTEQGSLWVVSKRAGAFAREAWSKHSGSWALPEKLPPEGVEGARLVNETVQLKRSHILKLAPFSLTQKGSTQVLLNEKDLTQEGSLFVWLTGQGPRILGTRIGDQNRPWARRP
jgi:competence protein ComEC